MLYALCRISILAPQIIMHLNAPHFLFILFFRCFSLNMCNNLATYELLECVAITLLTMRAPYFALTENVDHSACQWASMNMGRMSFYCALSVGLIYNHSTPAHDQSSAGKTKALHTTMYTLSAPPPLPILRRWSYGNRKRSEEWKRTI